MTDGFLYTRTHRTHRASEWSGGKVVTFIVTLAATRSVTLAARSTGMSRKAAYALKKRDPAFAGAWAKALATPKGNKVEEVEDPPVSPSRGNSRIPAAASTASIRMTPLARAQADRERDRYFARLEARLLAGQLVRPSPQA